MAEVSNIYQKILTEEEFVNKFLDDLLITSSSVQKPDVMDVADALNFYFGIVPSSSDFKPNHCLVYSDSDVNASDWNTNFTSINMMEFWNNIVGHESEVLEIIPNPLLFPQNQHFNYNTLVDGKLIHEGQLTVQGTIVNSAEVLNENAVTINFTKTSNIPTISTLYFVGKFIGSRGSGLPAPFIDLTQVNLIDGVQTGMFLEYGTYYLDVNKNDSINFNWQFRLNIDSFQPVQDARISFDSQKYYTMIKDSQTNTVAKFSLTLPESISFIQNISNIDIEITHEAIQVVVLNLASCTISAINNGYTETEIPIWNDLTYLSDIVFVEFYTPSQFTDIASQNYTYSLSGTIKTNAGTEPGNAFYVEFNKNFLSNLPVGEYFMRVPVPISINDEEHRIYMDFQVNKLADGTLDLRDRECFIELAQTSSDVVSFRNLYSRNVFINYPTFLGGVITQEGAQVLSNLNVIPRLINYVNLRFTTASTLYLDGVSYFSTTPTTNYNGSLIHTSHTPTIYSIAQKIVNKSLIYRIL